MTAIAFVSIPLGQLVGGYLMEWLGVLTFITVVAVVYLTVVASFIFSPVLHEMDQRPANASSSAAQGATDLETPPN